MQGEKQRAPRNKTLTMNILEREKYSKLLLIPDGSPLSLSKIINTCNILKVGSPN
jgi:hypothetical protein